MQIPHIGDSPSGKATDSDSVIRVFESLIPSHGKRRTKRCAFFRVLWKKSESSCIKRVFARAPSARTGLKIFQRKSAARRFGTKYQNNLSPATEKGAPNGVPFFVCCGKRARVPVLNGCSLSSRHVFLSEYGETLEINPKRCYNANGKIARYRKQRTA